MNPKRIKPKDGHKINEYNITHGLFCNHYWHFKYRYGERDYFYCTKCLKECVQRDGGGSDEVY